MGPPLIRDRLKTNDFPKKITVRTLPRDPLVRLYHRYGTIRSANPPIWDSPDWHATGAFSFAKIVLWAEPEIGK